MAVRTLKPALDPQTKSDIARAWQVSGNGYHINNSQIKETDAVLKYLRGIQKQPEIYYNIEASVNYNVVENAGDLSQVITGATTIDEGAVTGVTGDNTARQFQSSAVTNSSGVLNVLLKPNTLYNASVYLRKANGADLVQYRTKIVQNNNTIHQSSEVTITDEWQLVQFDFTTDAGALTTANSLFHIIDEARIHQIQTCLPQVTEGAGALPFQSRNSTTPQLINLGVAGDTGDSSVSGSNLAEMTTRDAVAGNVLRLTKTNGQGFDAGYVPASSQGANAITVAAWVKFDNLGAEEWVVAQSTELILRKSTDDKIEFILNSFSTNDRLKTNSTVNNNEWVFITGAYSTISNSIKVYLNGSSNGSITPTGSWGGSSSVVKFGHSFADMDGQIGDIFLLEKALSDGQIQQLYNLTRDKYTA